MLLTLLGFVAVILTLVMFQSKESMLGFPCALFWFLFGIQAYTLYAVMWDVYYCIFFFSCLGMMPFSVYAAFGLREKPDALETENEGEAIKEPSSKDKESEEEDTDEIDDYGEPITRPSKRVQALRDRAEKRRERMVKKKDSGSW